MAEVSARVRRRIESDFPHQADRVAGLLADLMDDEACGFEPRTPEGDERIQAAVLLIARGDLRQLDYALEIARTDWRDLLVWAGVGNSNWPEILEIELP